MRQDSQVALLPVAWPWRVALPLNLQRRSIIKPDLRMNGWDAMTNRIPSFSWRSALDQEDVPKEVALGILACAWGVLRCQRALERSIELDSNSVCVLFPPGILYEKTGATERALDVWHRFCRSVMTNPSRGSRKTHSVSGK